MQLKAPSKSASQEKIDEFANELADYFTTLRSRALRDLFRKDLEAKRKLYTTLASKRLADSVEHDHFMRLAIVYSSVMLTVGDEKPPKQRKAAPKTALVYPEFNPTHVMRLHFIAGVSLLRDRALAFADYCSFSFIQTASDGSRLISFGLTAEQIWIFERLVETLGESGLGFPVYNKAGFEFLGDSNNDFGLQSVTMKMQDDNWDARRFSEMSARMVRLDPNSKIRIPAGKPRIPEDLPWDPDPVFQRILDHTQTGDLEGAFSVLQTVDPGKQETIFDELLYLKFCLRKPINGHDIRYLVRKYIRKSSIRTQLEENFEDYLIFVDANVQLRVIDPADMPWRGLIDWEDFKSQAYRDFKDYGYSPHPRGRIFVWHPNLYSSSVDSYFTADFVDAENAFRVSRGIPEIGKGWVSEAALFDLIKSQFPDATFQWSPSWLGRQSIDVYVPSINVAFEYQGQQHYHPVELFGGEAGLVATQSRDQLKRTRLERNGVRLIEWHYSVPINKSNFTAYLDGSIDV